VIKILAVDDHKIVREGVKRLLEESPDIRVTAEATSGADALAQLAKHPADVVLLDVGMPGTSFLETLRGLRERFPETRVIVLTGHAEEEYAVRALKAGASGYVTKEHSSQELSMRCSSCSARAGA
jgi:DNA-binding NarL/FixJ family response regulator